MRVPGPDSLRLDRHELLELVRERLTAWGAPVRLDDPTDPAWMLLEEAAWMAETLSARMDAYPDALMQQALRVMGAELEPALPAVGLMAVTPADRGILDDADGEESTRFLTAQTEEREPVVFVPAERRVPMEPARVAGWYVLAGGQLAETNALVQAEDAPLGHALHPPPNTFERAGTFDRVLIRYRVRSTNPAQDLPLLEDAGELLTRDRYGYLRFSARPGDGDLILDVELDPCAGARRDPNDPTRVRIAWRAIHGTSWSPLVAAAAPHEALPEALWGREQTPDVDGFIVLPTTDPEAELSGLLQLERPSAPSSEVTDAIWASVEDTEKSLRGQKLSVKVLLVPTEDDADDARPWVASILESGAWADLAGDGLCDLVWIAFPQRAESAGVLRIATAIDIDAPHGSERNRTQLRHLGDGHSGLIDAMTHMAQRWRTTLPTADGRGQHRVTGWDVQYPAGSEGLLLRWATEYRDADGHMSEVPLEGLVLNPVLVFNAPVVVDGREVFAPSVGPVPVDLAATDVVTQDVLDAAVDTTMRGWWAPGLGAVDDPASRAFQTLKSQAQVGLARMHRVRADGAERTPEVFDNWSGVTVDPTEGRLVFRVPSVSATRSPVDVDRQRGVAIDWYRRTDGADGSVEAGRVHFIEQRVDAIPPIAAAVNPYPMVGGQAAESPEACIDRVYGANREQPLLPLEFERDLAQTLGPRAHGWWVRVWSYAERYLYELQMWQQQHLLRDAPRPADDPAGLFGEHASPTSVVDADETTLVVCMGPQDGSTFDATDFAWARDVTARWFRGLRQRYPMLQKLIVVPFRALTLHTPVRVTDERSIPESGFFAFPEGVYTGGFLEDAWGEQRRMGRDVVLVDAAIIDIRSVTARTARPSSNSAGVGEGA